MSQEERKKLLFIAPLFFDYYQEIIKEAESMGYEVDYVCDAPSNSNVSKAVGRINKRLIKGETDKYFNNDVLPVLRNKRYDKVLLIGGMTFSFTQEMFGQIKKLNPNAKFIMYQWDSEKNLPYSTGIHQYFDEVYSFDRFDCKAKTMYHFLPLFYTKTYENIGIQPINTFQYDCSYIGTAHPRKFKDINAMANALTRLMPKQFVYHYMPSKLKYIYHKITAPEYKKAKLNDFKMEKVPTEQMFEIFKQSRCILDAPQAGQTGLTIRTIECLGAKRKLITTNADIKNYDFYNEANVMIFDGAIDENSLFFTQPFVDISVQIYQKYSLRSWLSTMLA